MPDPLAEIQERWQEELEARLIHPDSARQEAKDVGFLLSEVVSLRALHVELWTGLEDLETRKRKMSEV